MPTKKQTISVRLDDKATQRVERAAKLMRQSPGAFLEALSSRNTIEGGDTYGHHKNEPG